MKISTKWLLWLGLCMTGMAALAAPAEDEAAIAQSMRMQWEKPGQPLDLPVIVVQHDVAIADWLLGARGGRALLKRLDGQWHTQLCGGAELRQVQRLQSAGLAPAAAAALGAALASAERRLSPQQMQQINSFQGVMDFTQEHHNHSHQPYEHHHP